MGREVKRVEEREVFGRLGREKEGIAGRWGWGFEFGKGDGWG